MRRILFAALLSCAVCAAPAEANFLVRVENGTTSPGGNTSIAVWVSSDNAGGEVLDSFGLKLQITRVSGTGTLQFSNPQSGAELSSPDYVFGSDSVNALLGPPTSLISTTSTTNDTFLGGDGTLSGGGVTVDGTERLLAIVDLNGSGAAAGDSYQISVVGFGTDLDLSPTFFANPTFDYYNWRPTSGTVTVEGVATAPAPPGFALALSGLVPLFGLALRSRWRAMVRAA